MYRLFEILKENLVEVYQNQSSFKQEIEAMMLTDFSKG